MIQIACLVLAFSQAMPAPPRIVDVRFESGRIWVTATRATVAQILAVWNRAGKTSFEGVEKAPDSDPVDLKLAGVPEEEALALLLRKTGGYTAIRRDDVVPAESTFARVLILGPRTVPAAISEPTESAPVMVQPALGPDGLPIPDDQQKPPPFRSMPPGFSPPPERPPQGRIVNNPVTGK